VMPGADHPGGLVAGGRTSGRMTGTPRRACSWAGPPVQRLRPGRPVGASAVELVSARADPRPPSLLVLVVAVTSPPGR
jgi:hypothetical protein